MEDKNNFEEKETFVKFEELKFKLINQFLEISKLSLFNDMVKKREPKLPDISQSVEVKD